jgi:vacuolar-type H+-ATPase subunit I/STV1
MARWFRSEPMEYISLIVNEDAAHDCLADLGKLGVIQFTDVRALVMYSLIEFCLVVDEAKWS